MNTLPALNMHSLASQSRVMAMGDWRLANMGQLADWPLPRLPGHIELDGSQLASLDPSGAWFMLQSLIAHGATAATIDAVGFGSGEQAIFNLVQQHVALEHPVPPPERHWLAALGQQSHHLIDQIGATLNLIGRLGIETAGMFIHPQRFRIKEFSAQLGAVFVDAIFLVLILMFLLGVVFAYLLGRQALQYGANLYVVDGTSLSICRELAPVLVAILIAGRSGSAITAQLGTMKFDDEIDAIRVLGLSPYLVLIIPRLLALVIALPLLVFLGDLAGLAGSMLVASQQLGITPAVFTHRLVDALDTSTVVIGLSKAPLFALFIGLIASQTGLQVARNARSIGLSTTGTVVNSIVAVIILNAIIAVALVKLGL